MSLIWQIALFLIVAAAIGCVIGWLLRGARMPSERPAAAPRLSGGEAALVDERDRLRTELQAARDAQAKLEASLAETEKLADARATRVRELEQAQASSQERIARLEDEPTRAPPNDIEGTPPQALTAPEGEPDDLKRISGIGPSIEKTLHGLGIYHFHQIAGFTPDNIAWVNQRLRFKGRIEREDWVGQAKKLTAEETIERG